MNESVTRGIKNDRNTQLFIQRAAITGIIFDERGEMTIEER